MRQILYKAACFAGATMLAMPVMAAAPAAAPVSEAGHNMACFMIMGHAVSEAEHDPNATPSGADNLKLATFFFAGKVADRNPGKNIMTVIQANKTAVQDAITRQEPAACAREVHDAMANPDEAKAPAAPKP